MGQMVKGTHFFQRRLADFKPPPKKGRVKFKDQGGGRGNIFRLLGILPKITDGTKGERYTLFRGV